MERGWVGPNIQWGAVTGCVPLPFPTRLALNRARAAAARLDAGGSLEFLKAAPAPEAAKARPGAILAAVVAGAPWTVGRWVTLQVELNELIEPGPGADVRVYVGTPREYYRNHAWRPGTRHWVPLKRPPEAP